MSINHQAEFGEIMYLIRDGLAPFVINKYRETYRDRYEAELYSLLNTDAFRLPESAISNNEVLLRALDTQRVLKLIRARRFIFAKVFTNWDHVQVALTYRNRWGHQDPVTNEEAQNAALTAAALLDAVGEQHRAQQARDLEKVLREKLAQQIEPVFAKQIREARHIIENLTEEQYRVIKTLTGKRRVAISGCAGSGKTLIAAQKAIKLAEAGLSTLLLCHSPELALYIMSLVGDAQVRILDFTSWIHLLNGSTLISVDNWSPYSEPTDEELTAAFDKLVESEERYDAIIIDEGQDFREEWWVMVEAALIHANSGILYIFHDDNQSLLPFRSKHPIETLAQPLSKNCRNAGKVFDVVRRFHSQSPELSLDLKDLGVFKKTVFRHQAHALDAIKETVREALAELNMSQVTVLTTEPDPVSNSMLEGLAIEMRPPWSWQDGVITALESEGFTSILSKNPYPTDEDIKIIADFASEAAKTLHLSPELYQRDRPTKWELDNNTLRLRPPSKLSREVTRGVVITFFSSGKWIKELPKPEYVQLSANKLKTNSSTSTISLHTVSTFKGLEADGVVLFVPTMRDNLEALLYVGVSRPRVQLYLVIDESVAGSLGKL